MPSFRCSRFASDTPLDKRCPIRADSFDFAEGVASCGFLFQELGQHLRSPLMPPGLNFIPGGVVGAPDFRERIAQPLAHLFKVTVAF